MTIDQLIAVRDFPAVVQAADIAGLRRKAPDDIAVADFVGGYLGFDERSRHALGVSVQALARPERGGAFFFNGVFGSGKSHLLGLLALLTNGSGHEAFEATHPHLAPLLQEFVLRLTIHFSLDNYEAGQFSLEDIFWRELQAEWKRHKFPELARPETGSRAEVFAALEEALAQHQLHGIVLCIDELSLFLSAKEHRALQADAAFLQFLGQRAARSRLCVFIALQKTMEDIGALEAYSLSQIKDRFSTLPLSLAHIPSLIEHRLIIRKDEDELHRACEESYSATLRALPRFDWGREEWQQLYPFHPGTIALLEQVVSRFFSRTRSAALFCAGAAHEAIADKADAGERILPDALFEYIAPELDGHPDLRPLDNVWRGWRESLPELANDEHDAAALQQLMKGLLLFKIAGTAPSIVQLTNSIGLDAKLPGDGNYDYARMLLERLRTRGSYLAVERREGDFADRYTIDLGTRVGEMARRATQSMMASLGPHDARVMNYALRCCRSEALPLASLENTRSFSVMWRNAPRGLAIEIATSSLMASGLANRIAMLSQPGSEEDALLLIAPPFADTATQNEQLLRETAQLIDDERWRAALLWWKPRAPVGAEWELALEATAQHLLQDDPQLLDNRRGRAILEHVKDNTTQREEALSRLAMWLLHEGQIVSAGGLAVDAGDLAGDNSWTATLEALCEIALPPLFPKFESIAPRLRVLTPANCDQMCLEMLRRPLEDPDFAASLERVARAVAEPLGIGQLVQGRWRIAALRPDLTSDIQALMAQAGPQDIAALAAVEAALAKSEWGLRREQVALAICALLRSGEVAALDARGKFLPPGQIGMPLRRSVHAIRPGQLLKPEAWEQVRALASLLTSEPLEAISFAEQERAWTLLLRWREEAASETELAQARLHQLRRALHHTPAQWPQTEAALEHMAVILATLNVSGTAVEGLERAVTLDIQTIRPTIEAWRQLLANLEQRHAALLSAYAGLSHPDLATPPALQEARAALIARFDEGEAVLADDDLLHAATEWLDTYATQYREWHAAQHDPARWSPYRRLAGGEALRALEKLAAVSARPLDAGGEVRAAIEEETAKICSRDGSLHSGEAVCNACRLRLGERVKLRDPRELEDLIASGVATLRAALREVPVHDFLARDGGTPLLDWDSSGGEPTALLPILNDQALYALDEALRPRRSVARHWAQLQQTFATCRTRAEYEAAFAAWLDGGDNLAPDDEIEVQ